jgi:hypothetical protein
VSGGCFCGATTYLDDDWVDGRVHAGKQGRGSDKAAHCEGCLADSGTKKCKGYWQGLVVRRRAWEVEERLKSGLQWGSEGERSVKQQQTTVQRRGKVVI